MSAESHFFDIYKNTKLALETVLSTSTDYADMPVVADNDSANDIDLSDGFIYYTVEFGNSQMATVNPHGDGTRKIRTEGVLFCQLNMPKDQGISKGYHLAGLLAKAFRDRSINNIYCFAPTIETGRQMRYGESEFWVLPLICNFRYDELVEIL